MLEVTVSGKKISVFPEEPEEYDALLRHHPTLFHGTGLHGAEPANPISP